jgi:hypothetical protein
MMTGNVPLDGGGATVTWDVTVLENPSWDAGKKMGPEKAEGCTRNKFWV